MRAISHIASGSLVAVALVCAASAAIASNVAGAAAPAAAVAGATSAPGSGSVPSSLCSLRVARQLRSLDVGSDCSSARVQPGNELAYWGLHSDRRTGRVLILQLAAGVSEANARNLVPERSLKVAVGSFAREWVDANKVELVAWARNIEFQVTIGLRASSHPSLAVMTKFLAPTVAFAHAVAAQV